MSKLIIFILVAVAVCANAFVVSPPTSVRSSSELQMTVLTHKGKKANFKAGTPLKNAVGKLGVKPKYSCRK
jgi:hypothetical protein